MQGSHKLEKNLRCPDFFEEAELLNGQLKKLTGNELAMLMKISPKIAEQTRRHIHDFSSKSQKRASAFFAYSGTVFQSLDPFSLSANDLQFAEEHVRILSGIYGVLRPNDQISPYRLEMKTPLKNPAGSNLYAFWKGRIYQSLLSGDGPIINLASTEYFKALDYKKIASPVISLQFKERKAGKIQTVGMYSKIARGLMARRIIVEQVSDPLLLQRGDTGGYFFSSELSSEGNWVFVR